MEKQSDKIDMLYSKFREAHDLLVEEISYIDAFKITFLLFAYKRFDDLLKHKGSPGKRIISIPKGCRWDQLPKQSSDVFELLSKNIKEISYKNGLIDSKGNTLDRITGILEYKNRIPDEEQKELINIFSNLDLSEKNYSIDEIRTFAIRIIDVVLEGDYPENNLLFSVNRLVMKLLDPQNNDLLYAPTCGIGDPLIAAVEHYAEKIASSNKKGRSKSDIPSLKLKGEVHDSTMWSIAVLRLALAGASVSEIKNEDYLSKETYNLHTGYYTKYFPIEENIDLIDFLKIKFLKEELLKKDKPSLIFLDIKNGFCLKGKKHPVDDVGEEEYEIPQEINYEKEKFIIPESYGEMLFLLLALKQLKQNGRMAIVLPIRDLFSESVSTIRRFLIDKDYIEAIIQFSSKGTAGFAVIVLCKRKEKNKKGKIVFTETREAYDLSYANDDEFPINERNRIHKLFKTSVAQTDNEFVATQKDIQKNNYILLPDRYLSSSSSDLDYKEIQAGKTLKQISTIKSGIAVEHIPNVESVNGDYYVTSENLSRNIIHDPYLNIHNIKKYRFAKNSDISNFITKKCILVSLAGNGLKPTTFNPTLGVKIWLAADVAAIFPDEKNVDFNYVFHKLDSPIVIKQFELYVVKTTEREPHITIEDLASISIPYVETLEQQRAIIKDEVHQAQSAITAKYKDYIVGEQAFQHKLIGYLTHEIKNDMPIQSIKKVMKFIEEKGYSDSIIFKSETVREFLTEAYNSLEGINSIANRLSNVFSHDVRKEDFEELNIKGLLDEFKPQYKKDFSIKVKSDRDVPDKILIHKFYFKLGIKNILDNAKKHAFPEKQKDASVEFKIERNSDGIVIHYINNGILFNVPIENFATPGEKGPESKGNGLGGAIINYIFKEVHNGDFKIIQDTNPIHFELILPYGD